MAALALIVPGLYVVRPAAQARGVPRRVRLRAHLRRRHRRLRRGRIYYIVENWARSATTSGARLFGGIGFTWYGGLIGGFLARRLDARCAACRSAWSPTPRHRRWRSATPSAASAASSPATATTASRATCRGRWAIRTAPCPRRPACSVQPTPIYEILIMLPVFWVLWRMAKKPQPGWYVFGWFLVLSGVERFPIEFVRRNPIWLWDSRAAVDRDRERRHRCRRSSSCAPAAASRGPAAGSGHAADGEPAAAGRASVVEQQLARPAQS